MTSPSEPFEAWLQKHFKQALTRYNELSKLDDEDMAGPETGEYYEIAHQMFGYVSALEACSKQLKKTAPARAKIKPNTRPKKKKR